MSNPWHNSWRHINGWHRSCRFLLLCSSIPHGAGELEGAVHKEAEGPDRVCRLSTAGYQKLLKCFVTQFWNESVCGAGFSRKHLMRAGTRIKSNVYVTVTCTVFPITRWLGLISYWEYWKQEGYFQQLEGPGGSDPLRSLSGRIRVWILRSLEDLLPQESSLVYPLLLRVAQSITLRSLLPVGLRVASGPTDHTNFAIKLKNIECFFMFFLIKP